METCCGCRYGQGTPRRVMRSSGPRFSRFGRRRSRHPEELGMLRRSSHPISGRPDSRVVDGTLAHGATTRTPSPHGRPLDPAHRAAEAVRRLPGPRQGSRPSNRKDNSSWGLRQSREEPAEDVAVLDSDDVFPGPGISTRFPFGAGGPREPRTGPTVSRRRPPDARVLLEIGDSPRPLGPTHLRPIAVSAKPFSTTVLKVPA